MTSPDSSAPAADLVGAEAPTDDVIRCVDCPWCSQRLRISFFLEVWSGSFVHAVGGHVCPEAPVQSLPGDGEAAA